MIHLMPTWYFESFWNGGHFIQGGDELIELIKVDENKYFSKVDRSNSAAYFLSVILVGVLFMLYVPFLT